MILHCFQIGEKEGLRRLQGYRPLVKTKGVATGGTLPPLGVEGAGTNGSTPFGNQKGC